MGDDKDQRAAILRLAESAGVTKDEMFDHPIDGLCISLSGVRKMALFAPDKSKAVRAVEAMEQAAQGSKGIRDA